MLENSVLTTEGRNQWRNPAEKSKFPVPGEGGGGKGCRGEHNHGSRGTERSDPDGRQGRENQRGQSMGSKPRKGLV